MLPLVFLGASFVEAGSPIVSAWSVAAGQQAEAMGARGASLSRWVSIATAEPREEPTPALVVEMGGNTGRVTAGDINDADAQLRAAGYVPRWVLPPLWPDEAPSTVRERRQAMREAIEASSVAKVRHNWGPLMTDLARDGIHLRRDAYEAFGRAIAAAPDIISSDAARRIGRAVAILAGVGVVAWGVSRAS